MTSEIRPFRKINRKKTKEISVGKVKVGGNNPITVQTMTNTLTTDHKSTIEQINKVAEAGADIVRVSCPDRNSTESLKTIINSVKNTEIRSNPRGKYFKKPSLTNTSLIFSIITTNKKRTATAPT